MRKTRVNPQRGEGDWRFKAADRIFVQCRTVGAPLSGMLPVPPVSDAQRADLSADERREASEVIALFALRINFQQIAIAENPTGFR
jgi:hypothetical protein